MLFGPRVPAVFVGAGSYVEFDESYSIAYQSHTQPIQMNSDHVLQYTKR